MRVDVELLKLISSLLNVNRSKSLTTKDTKFTKDY